MTERRSSERGPRPIEQLLLFATRFQLSTRRLSILLALALALMTSLTVALVINRVRSTSQHQQAERWYVHTLDVLIETGELRTAVYSAQRGQRNYLLTGDSGLLRDFADGKRQTRAAVAKLGALTADNPRQRENLTALNREVTNYYALLGRASDLEAQGRHAEVIAMVHKDKGVGFDAVLTAIGSIEGAERSLLATRKLDMYLADRRVATYGYGLIALGFLALSSMGMVGILAIRTQARATSAASDLHRIANTDALTGLANRRAFFEALEEEAEKSERSGAQLWVTILDIDRFKRINDNYGHPAGDEVLRAVAAILRQALRGNDLVGRIGGEEFGVLMPRTTRAQAEMVSERLRLAVANTPFELPSGKVIEVTLSAGLAVRAKGEDPTHLLSRTDIALYMAKKDGRNLVRLAA
ncbi:MAG: diguanylate cyclase [Sphingomonas sp.]